MEYEGYPRGSRHCLILADGQVVCETQNESDAEFLVMLFDARVPGVEHTVKTGVPFHVERIFT